MTVSSPSLFWRRTRSLGAGLLLLLSACSDPEVRVYEIPKEESPPFNPLVMQSEQDRAEGTSPPPSGMGDATGEIPSPGMARGTLPESTMADSADPRWEVPESWEEGPEVSARRGSYRVRDTEGRSLDIAITVFPGDVGGPLANVNRWRQQVQLPPVDATGLAELREEIAIGGLPGWMVVLPGPTTTTIAATVEVEGNSWFFRMTGDPELAQQEQARFGEFLASVEFQ